jgi:hypothetical protein
MYVYKFLVRNSTYKLETKRAPTSVPSQKCKILWKLISFSVLLKGHLFELRAISHKLLFKTASTLIIFCLFKFL